MTFQTVRLLKRNQKPLEMELEELEEEKLM